ncbi:MAG: hypothetical protein WA733_21785 [Methylocystis sp.]
MHDATQVEFEHFDDGIEEGVTSESALLGGAGVLAQQRADVANLEENGGAKIKIGLAAIIALPDAAAIRDIAIGFAVFLPTLASAIIKEITFFPAVSLAKEIVVGFYEQGNDSGLRDDALKSAS